jgi:hypothetical protein
LTQEATIDFFVDSNKFYGLINQYLIQNGAEAFQMLSTNCNNDREFC